MNMTMQPSCKVTKCSRHYIRNKHQLSIFSLSFFVESF